ncbi:MAG: HAMP domain-containing sensor histidine kinase [Tuberibacillus sp.]
MGKKLVNIQWRSCHFAMWVAFLTAMITLMIVSYFEGIDLRHLYFNRIWGIPYGLWLLLFILLVGSSLGYFIGMRLKRRLESLVATVLRLERGNYSCRAPYLGEDEVGQVAIHLNLMAEHIEQQVASLQKLSSEKAEWNDQLRREAVTEERQRLARELHDAVSQQLFAISMLASAVKESYFDNPEGTAKQLEMIEKMAGHAQNEMRALLLHLRPARLNGKCLKDALDELLTEQLAKQQLKIQWKIDDIGSLPKGVEDHLFRIVQESLSNIMRHAKAETINVRLVQSGKQINLKIIDDGIGFDPSEQKTSSYGLKSIKERVNEIGGVVEFVSIIGRGTEIKVKVPLVEGVKGNNDPSAVGG